MMCFGCHGQPKDGKRDSELMDCAESPRPRVLPFAIGADGDAESPRRHLYGPGTVRAFDNAVAGALADAVEAAPFLEGQNLIVGERRERRIEREHALAHGRLPPAPLFVLVVLLGYPPGALPPGFS